MKSLKQIKANNLITTIIGNKDYKNKETSPKMFKIFKPYNNPITNQIINSLISLILNP